MAFDIEGAKAAGYTDQEIQQYLAADEADKKNLEYGNLQVTPSNQPIAELNRTPERAITAAGAATAGAMAAAPYVGGAAGIAAIPKVLEHLRGGPVAPPAGAPMAQAAVPKVAQAAGEQSIKSIAMQGIARGAAGVAQAVAPYAAVAAIPGAMMAKDYANFQQQTPEQQYESAQSALAGQSPGQAW